MEVTHTDKASGLPLEIASRFDPSSPEYRRYINSFYSHSEELTSIFISKPDILLRWDGLMNEFNTNDLSITQVNQTHRDQLKKLLHEVYLSASAPLRSAIDNHRLEIDHFPDTMAFLLFSFYFF